jgi:hypothetical protein
MTFFIVTALETSHPTYCCFDCCHVSPLAWVCSSVMPVSGRVVYRDVSSLRNLPDGKNVRCVWSPVTFIGTAVTDRESGEFLQ